MIYYFDSFNRQSEYFQELEQGRAEAEKKYLTLPKEKVEALKKQAMLNIKWQGKDDWSKLGEAEKQEKIRLAAIYEMAATSHLPKVAQLVKSPDNVLIFTKSPPDFIGIGSCQTSIAKHWVGFGVLEKRENSFIPRILSPSQYQKFIASPYQIIPCQLINQPHFTQILLSNIS